MKSKLQKINIVLEYDKTLKDIRKQLKERTHGRK